MRVVLRTAPLLLALGSLGCARTDFGPPGGGDAAGGGGGDLVGGDLAGGDLPGGGDFAGGDPVAAAGDSTWVPLVEPQYVGGVEVGWTVNDTVVAGGGLYVGSSAPGAELRIYDLSDPRAPVLRTTAGCAGDVEAVALWGSLAYVVGQSAELEIFDVGVTPPVRLGAIATADVGQAVVVVADRVYVTTSGAGGDDLEVIDVGNPALPVKLGGIDLQPNYTLKGLQVVGTIAYAAGQQLWAVDVSDPAAMTVLGQAGFYWYAEDLQVVGNLAYGLEQNNTGSQQLRIFDISDPTDITLIGACYLSQSYTRNIDVVGTTVYAVIDDIDIDRLDVVDASDPANPEVIGYADLGVGGNAVVVSGSLAYVGLVESTGEELRVFELQ